MAAISSHFWSIFIVVLVLFCVALCFVVLLIYIWERKGALIFIFRNRSWIFFAGYCKYLLAVVAIIECAQEGAYNRARCAWLRFSEKISSFFTRLRSGMSAWQWRCCSLTILGEEVARKHNIPMTTSESTYQSFSMDVLATSARFHPKVDCTSKS